MPEEITPQAKPIANTGEPEWFPPAQDDALTYQPKTSAVHRVFLGRDGLRAGWALLLWIAFIAAIAQGVTAILRVVRHHTPHPPHAAPEWLILSNSAIGFLVVGLAGVIVSRIERRPWSHYGIGSLRGRGSEFGWGLLAGFSMLSVLIAILWQMKVIAFGGLLLHGAGTIALWALIFALSFLFTGFFEEFAFRGFPQFTLTRGIAGILRSVGMEDHAPAIAFWITAILLGIGFGAVHGGNAGESRIGLYAAGLIGFAFAFSLWRTGSLWWAIGFHAAWDWGESFFYGTADSGGVSPHRLMESHPQGDPLYSGGTVGPEGSVLIFIAIVLVFAIIALFLKPRAGSPSARM